VRAYVSRSVIDAACFMRYIVTKLAYLLTSRQILTESQSGLMDWSANECECLGQGHVAPPASAAWN